MAMTLKIGDRVKLKGGSAKGRLATVSEVDGDRITIKFDNGAEVVRNSDQLQKVYERSNKATKYKVKWADLTKVSECGEGLDLFLDETAPFDADIYFLRIGRKLKIPPVEYQKAKKEIADMTNGNWKYASGNSAFKRTVKTGERLTQEQIDRICKLVTKYWGKKTTSKKAPSPKKPKTPDEGYMDWLDEVIHEVVVQSGVSRLYGRGVIEAWEKKHPNSLNERYNRDRTPTEVAYMIIGTQEEESDDPMEAWVDKVIQEMTKQSGKTIGESLEIFKSYHDVNARKIETWYKSGTDIKEVAEMVLPHKPAEPKKTKEEELKGMPEWISSISLALFQDYKDVELIDSVKMVDDYTVNNKELMEEWFRAGMSEHDTAKRIYKDHKKSSKQEEKLDELSESDINRLADKLKRIDERAMRSAINRDSDPFSKPPDAAKYILKLLAAVKSQQYTEIDERVYYALDHDGYYELKEVLAVAKFFPTLGEAQTKPVLSELSWYPYYIQELHGKKQEPAPEPQPEGTRLQLDKILIDSAEADESFWETEYTRWTDFQNALKVIGAQPKGRGYNKVWTKIWWKGLNDPVEIRIDLGAPPSNYDPEGSMTVGEYAKSRLDKTDKHRLSWTDTYIPPSEADLKARLEASEAIVDSLEGEEKQKMEDYIEALKILI